MLKGESYTVHLGSNLDILPTLPDNSVDAIVTDPPYGLSDNKYIDKTLIRWISGERDFIPDGKGFMGKSWDSFVPPPALWDECLRVLKPGGHLLAFFGSRTQDIGALSIRLAGFEIRDSIAWMYGSGFPKSLDISKAIDKAAGADREVIDTVSSPFKIDTGAADAEYSFMHGTTTMDDKGYRTTEITKPSTPEAQQWEGWGTALKPAHEPIVVARKPLIGTVAETVLEYGTGGLNIDGSRIGTDITTRNSYAGTNGVGWGMGTKDSVTGSPQGRWPSNVILDPYTAELLDEQSGTSKSNLRPATGKPKLGNATSVAQSGGTILDLTDRGHNDSGGASRFFYVAKASKRDRNEGLEELETKQTVGGGGLGNPVSGAYGSEKAAGKNFHPTVKPTDLMRYLVKLVTPPNGVVLDPFTGSGSTGKAAILEGFDFIGIELTEEYLPIIEGRLKHAEELRLEEQAKKDEALF